MYVGLACMYIYQGGAVRLGFGPQELSCNLERLSCRMHVFVPSSCLQLTIHNFREQRRMPLNPMPLVPISCIDDIPEHKPKKSLPQLASTSLSYKW